MPALDAHIHAFEDDLTERASLDRINRAKEHWRAYVQGCAELELMRNKMALRQAVLRRISDRMGQPEITLVPSPKPNLSSICSVISFLDPAEGQKNRTVR